MKKLFLLYLLLGCTGILSCADTKIYPRLAAVNTYNGTRLTPETIPGLMPSMPTALATAWAEWATQKKDLLATLAHGFPDVFDHSDEKKAAWQQFYDVRHNLLAQHNLKNCSVDRDDGTDYNYVLPIQLSIKQEEQQYFVKIPTSITRFLYRTTSHSLPTTQTYKNVCFAGHYLNFLRSGREHKYLYIAKPPKTYLVTIPGKAPDSFTDEDCLILQQAIPGWTNTANPKDSCIDPEKLNSLPDEVISELFALITECPLWDPISENIMVKKGKVYVHDLEGCPFNHPDSTFMQHKQVYDKNVALGFIKLAAALQKAPTKLARLTALIKQTPTLMTYSDYSPKLRQLVDDPENAQRLFEPEETEA